MREIAFGVITAWAGSIAGIPPGWFLCDGTNDTPDLRNKFVIATGPIFAVGDEAGATTHTHTATSAAHSHVMADGIGLDSDIGTPRDSNLATDTMTTDPTSSLPNFYALAYIQYNGT